MLARSLGWLATCSAIILYSGALSTSWDYDEEEAKMMASLSSATYHHEESQILDWSCQPCKDSKTPMAPGKVRVVDAGKKNASRIIIGKLRDQAGCLLAFRGSSNAFNWVRNFQVWEVEPTVFDDCKGCKVHSGFFSIWKNVEDEVLRGLRDVGCSPGGSLRHPQDDLVYVTGHSLGAALTHIAMFALDSAGFRIAKTYSFDGPRVGNKAFAEAFSDAFSRKFPVFRIANHKDPCVQVPPISWGYFHVEKEVYYNGNGLGDYKVCKEPEDPTCSGQFGGILNLPGLILFHAGDHCNSPLVPNGNICNPDGDKGPEHLNRLII